MHINKTLRNVGAKDMQESALEITSCCILSSSFILILLASARAALLAANLASAYGKKDLKLFERFSASIIVEIYHQGQSKGVEPNTGASVSMGSTRGQEGHVHHIREVRGTCPPQQGGKRDMSTTLSLRY